MKLRVLDLFAGIGGFSLGLERTGGFETVAFCEIEPYAQKVLAKHWPKPYLHTDIRTLNRGLLWKRLAQNAVLNQLCEETPGSTPTAKRAITHISESEGQKIERDIANIITSGLITNADLFLNIMEGNAPAAVSPSTPSLQSTTLKITEALSDKNTKGLFGSSLSNGDYQVIIKYFATTVMRQNMCLASAPIKNRLDKYYDDVRELTAERLASDGIGVDVITGGFPCQDISVAGKGAGIEGERSGLWSDLARLIGELRPRYALMENVTAIISGGGGQWFGRVLGDLAALGYDCEWHCIPASELGADHRRDRVWIIADPECQRLKGPGRYLNAVDSAAHTDWEAGGFVDAFQRGALPYVCREHDGVSSAVDRNRCLGNAVVPQIPELIGRAILEAEA